MTVSDHVFDARGRLSGWIEGGRNYRVTRLSSGAPVVVQSSSGQSLRFSYGLSGDLKSVTGSLETVFLSMLFLEAKSNVGLTDAEKQDFAQSRGLPLITRNGLGAPAGLVDPATGQPVGGGQSGPLSIANLAARFSGRTPKRLFTIGTSWADGTGASNLNTTSFRGLLNNRYAGVLTPINAARGGANTEWHVTANALKANAASPLGPGDITFYEAGFNDYTTGDGSPKHINAWKKTFLATLAWWCVPQRQDSLCSRMALYNYLNPTAKQLTQQPNISTVGSWTIGYGNASAEYRLCYGGASATFTGQGDTIYVIRWRGTSSTQELRTVVIDGVSMEVNQAQGAYATTTFVPVLERYYVSPGQHTVVVNDLLVSEVMIFYRGKVPAQTVLVQDCHDVRLDARVDNGNTTSTSLSLTAPNAWWWDEGLLQRYRKAIRECVDIMAYDGWEIGIVEQGNWDPTIHTANPGGGVSAVYHPNDRGHYQLHLPPADAIDRLLGRK